MMRRKGWRLRRSDCLDGCALYDRCIWRGIVGYQMHGYFGRVQ
jgi:hypothetical protein